MKSFLNQHSLFLAVIALAFLAWRLLRRPERRRMKIIVLSCSIAAVIGTWLLLYPRQSALTSSQQVRSLIGAGTPVLLEFQSPYCLGCVAVKPTVDSLERELGSRLRIIRVNIQDHLGSELADAYSPQLTPTFIFFDGNGDEAWRSTGLLDRQQVRSSVK